jgi:hypothetical protein
MKAFATYLAQQSSKFNLFTDLTYQNLIFLYRNPTKSKRMHNGDHAINPGLWARMRVWNQVLPPHRKSQAKFKSGSPGFEAGQNACPKRVPTCCSPDICALLREFSDNVRNRFRHVAAADTGQAWNGSKKRLP